MRDPSLPHQIVISLSGGPRNEIYVSCNCRGAVSPKGGSIRYKPLEARARWDPEDVLAVYRAHLAEVEAA